MIKRIPPPVRTIVAETLGRHLYNHRAIQKLLHEAGAPGEKPEGSCIDSIDAWLLRCDDDPGTDAFGVLRRALQRYMELPRGGPGARIGLTPEDYEAEKKTLVTILANSGLAYEAGGRIAGAASSRLIPTRTLEDRLRQHDFTTVQEEFARADGSIEADPRQALTAARAIVESLCKIYIEDSGLQLPSDNDLGALWKVVRDNLGLNPATIQAENDIKQILSGLGSIVSGIGAFRSRAGSAHGQGRTPYNVEPRHARLAVGAAHTLVTFLIETWQKRRNDGSKKESHAT